MKEAVIVSTARTPIGKAYRGGFNNLQAPTMGAHAIRAAVERAGIEADRVEDCIMGAALKAHRARTLVETQHCAQVYLSRFLA